MGALTAASRCVPFHGSVSQFLADRANTHTASYFVPRSVETSQNKQTTYMQLLTTVSYSVLRVYRIPFETAVCCGLLSEN